MIEKHFDYTPYAYVYNNPIALIDPFGLDSVYVLDQGSRPDDDGTNANTYTADIYVVQNGEINGPYKGSSYPNSVEATGDNSTDHNTINEGSHEYNNATGHDGGTEKGLNIVDSEGNRANIPGTDPDGNAVDMELVNAHEGFSNNGNYNSRGSEGCVTVKPGDANNFLNNFNWSGANGVTGTSTGSMIIQRGANADATRFNIQRQHQ